MSNSLKYMVTEGPEYSAWYEKQSVGIQATVDARVFRIEQYGHLGDHRYLHDKLFELRWANGTRIYYVLKAGNEIAFLAGGNKNGQEKDIAKARRILKKSIER